MIAFLGNIFSGDVAGHNRAESHDFFNPILRGNAKKSKLSKRFATKLGTDLHWTLGYHLSESWPDPVFSRQFFDTICAVKKTQSDTA